MTRIIRQVRRLMNMTKTKTSTKAAADLPRRERKMPVPMTKYEHAKIIGLRAEQIARGAQIFVSDEGERFDPIAIALRELNAGVLPFIVVRKLPDGTEEHRRLRDFILPA